MDSRKALPTLAFALLSFTCSRESSQKEVVTTGQQQVSDSSVRNDRQNKIDSIQQTGYMSPYVWLTSDEDSLQTKFINRLLQKFQEIDSIKTGYTEFDINFVVEAFYKNEGQPEAALYLLEIEKGKDSVNIYPKYIGKYDGNIKSVQTPGDFYYYMMMAKREHDIEALKSCILKTGFRKMISDGSYREEKTIKRDSIRFEDLSFEFDLYRVNFTFNLGIDEAFSTEGASSLGYSGGGFYNSIYFRKKGDKIFLEEYQFNGH